VFWWNAATKEASWVDPSAAVADEWIPQVDTARNRTYYYNRRTGQSAWKLPAGCVAGSA
jgi:hypothetical protein